MKKKLTLNGNSWHLYINKPVADLMGINKENYVVNLKIENNTLYVSKEFKKGYLSTKKLLKRGSGYGLNFSLPILDLLNINPESDEVEITLDKSVLIIKKP